MDSVVEFHHVVFFLYTVVARPVLCKLYINDSSSECPSLTGCFNES